MKRYDEYKPTGVEWLPEIPTGWEVKRFKFIADTQKGRIPAELFSDPSDSTAPYLAMDYLRGNPKQLWYAAKNDGNSIEVKDGELLLLWDGSNAGEFMTGKAGILSSTMGKITPRIPINETYLFHYAKFFERILKEGTIGMGIPHVNPAILADAAVPLPPLTEQRAIAQFLDNKTIQLDQLIAQKQQMLALLREERAALINHVVTKGLDAATPLRDSGIEWLGEVPAHWEVKRLKHAVDSLNYKRVPLSSEERGKMVNRDYDYYGASGVIDKVEGYLFDDTLILLGEDGANLLSRNTRLAFIASGKFWVNNHAHILGPRKNNVLYLSEMLEAIDYSIYVTGSAQPKLTQEALLEIIIPVPPVTEQNAIAHYLTTENKRIDEIADTINQEITLLQEYRAALIAEAVTGQIDVRHYESVALEVLM